MPSENLHENHRERLRDVYLSGGFKSMAPHNVLELMLFYAVPRKDTNPIAHRLIDRFGSVGGILEADTEELMKVEGVGKGVAVYLKMFLDVFRLYESEKNVSFDQLLTVADLGGWLRPQYIGLKKELALLLCLDSNMTVISCTELSEGSFNSTEISFRKVAETAIRQNASFAVLSHNHPGATAIPSSTDISTTNSLQPLLKELGIILLDHLVFADGDFVSMAQSGYIKSYINKD